LDKFIYNLKVYYFYGKPVFKTLLCKGGNMRKNNLLFWIVLMGILLGVGSFYYSAYGFTTLSLSQVQFVDNPKLPSGNTLWSGKTWVLTITQQGMGQRAYASYSPETLQEKANSEERPEEDFEIDVEWNNQQCKWEVLNDENKIPLATYRVVFWNIFFGSCSSEDAESHCNAGKIIDYGKVGTGWSYPIPCYCVEEIKKGYFKKFGKNWIKSSGQIYLKGKETASCNLDTEGTTGISQGYCGDKVYVIWDGHLLKNSCNPVGDDYVPLYKDGNLKLIGMNSYQNYVSSYNDLIDYLNSDIISANTLKQKVDSVNNKYNNLNYYSAGYFEGSTYVQDLDYSAVNPMWTLYVKSDFLGIYQPRPKFVIESLSQDKMNMKIRVYIRNDGDTGSGDLSISCEPPFYPDLNALPISIRGGESKLYEIGYSVESNSPVERICTVKVSSVNGVVTKDIPLSYEPKQYCVPGHKKCFDNNRVVKKCNVYGTAYEFVETCKEGCICTYDNEGEAYCRNMTQGDVCGDGVCTGFEDYKNCPQDCPRPGFELDIDTMILILVGILGIGTSSLIVKKAFFKKKGKRK